MTQTVTPMPWVADLPIGHHWPVFEGHFPGHPIVPGAMLLDRVIESLRSCGALPHVDASSLLEVSAVKFLGLVAPGCVVSVSCTATAEGGVRFECQVDDRKVATGTLKVIRR